MSNTGNCARKKALESLCRHAFTIHLFSSLLHLWYSSLRGRSAEYTPITMAPVAVEPSHNPIADIAAASSSKTPIADAHTLDFSHWTGPRSDEASRASFAAQLRDACAGLGFFYLANTPLDKGDLRKRVFALNEAFFALPLDVRQQITIVNSPHFRGFSKFGDETTLHNVDHRDQIDYGLEMKPVTETDTQANALLEAFPFLNLLGPNQFLPDTVLKDHKSLILQWLDLCQDVARELTSALEVALGAQQGELQRFLLGDVSARHTSTDALAAQLQSKPRPYARAKTIRYPVASSIDGVERLKGSTQGVGAHKDGGWITLLATSAHRGLQVQALDGTWQDVLHHPHALIVNFGQQIERVSRGHINAATHRVLSGVEGSDGQETLASDRFSVAFFSMPALNSVVEPIAPSSLSSEIRNVWKQAQEERRRLTGREEAVTDVPKGDLWGRDDAPFGFQAWAGITRSHRNVVERYGYDNV